MELDGKSYNARKTKAKTHLTHLSIPIGHQNCIPDCIILCINETNSIEEKHQKTYTTICSYIHYQYIHPRL